MARRRQPADPRQDLRLAVDQLERHALEIVRQIAPGGALVGVPGKVQLFPLHDVARAWEGESLPRQVATRMIEVKVRINDPADVLRPVPQLAQGVLQLRATILTGVLDAVDVAELA